MTARLRLIFVFAICSVAHLGSGASAAPAAPSFTVRSIALPGAPPEGVLMDYLAYDRNRHRVWVPAGNTGSVDVIDAAKETVTRIEGFHTAEIERGGKKRIVGPSSATVGDSVVYVGNRGDSSICAVDADSLRLSACVKLDSSPDGLAYVASTHEVWVTMPRDKSIGVLDTSVATALTWKTKISLPGQPEGFAVDDARGLFYTNLEDGDRTLTIDIKSRKVTRTWESGCGEGGPKGLALDHGLDFLLVACPDRVEVLDAGHDGKRLSSIEVGEGVDNIDYIEQRHELYAAAAGAAKLTIVHLAPEGGLTAIATVATVAGARNSVATDEGTAYLTDAAGGKILIVAPVVSP